MSAARRGAQREPELYLQTPAELEELNSGEQKNIRTRHDQGNELGPDQSPTLSAQTKLLENQL